MLPITILDLILNISENTSCPLCKGKIFPEDIKVNSVGLYGANLKIHCGNCNKNIDANVLAKDRDPEDFKEKKRAKKQEEDMIQGVKEFKGSFRDVLN